MSVIEVLILQKVAEYADKNQKINKSEVARELDTSRTTVVNTIRKFKEAKINVRS